jgi:hypothetical protein
LVPTASELLSVPGDLHPEEVEEHLAVRPVRRVLSRAPDVEVDLLRRRIGSPPGSFLFAIG